MWQWSSHNMCILHSMTHDRMGFNLQLNGGIPKGSYTSTKDQILHWIGLGSGNGGTHWSFISIPMTEIVEEVAPGCEIECPTGIINWTITILSFVDDKRHYVKSLQQ